MSNSGRSKEPVEIYREVNFAALRQPSLDEIYDESAWWLPYHDYWGGYFGSSFEAAARSLEWERATISRLPARTEEAQDQFLSELDGEDIAAHIGSLDLGVAAAVLALSAAGCAILVSCSGHFGEGRWSSYPMIQFAAGSARCSSRRSNLHQPAQPGGPASSARSSSTAATSQFSNVSQAVLRKPHTTLLRWGCCLARYSFPTTCATTSDIWS